MVTHPQQHISNMANSLLILNYKFYTSILKPAKIQFSTNYPSFPLHFIKSKMLIFSLQKNCIFALLNLAIIKP